jgi:dTDP-4-dehydrorhamnose 3,5-epimerase
MVFDVVIDLRPDSKSLNKVVSVILGENSVYKGLIIPAGCAHGYLTLEPNSDFIYFMDKAYMPALSRGIRWNDPKYSIPWPLEPRLISDQDLNWPLL